MKHALTVLTLMLAGCDLQPPNVGTFNLKNEVADTVPLTVSERDDCVIGLHGDLASNTWRNFDIPDKTKGAYVCLAGKPFPVADGKSYAFDGTAIREVSAP
jgi:hypothetical protein